MLCANNNVDKLINQIDLFESNVIEDSEILSHVKDLPKAKVKIVQTQRVNKEILVTSSKYSN